MQWWPYGILLHMPQGRKTVEAIDHAVAAEIRALIGRAGRQDKDVAADAGIPPSTFSKMVRRPVRPMTVQHLAAIAGALGTEPGDIMSAASRAYRANPALFKQQAEIGALGLSDRNLAEVEAAARETLESRASEVPPRSGDARRQA